MGEFLPLSFPYILIRLVDTNSTVSSSLSTVMSSYDPPPFTYPITSTSGPFVPSDYGLFASPQSSSLGGSGTTFHFQMGSSLVIGLEVPSTTTITTTTSTSLPGTFLYGVHLLCTMFPLLLNLE